MTWYVVFAGRKTGVFRTWRECHEQVHRYPDNNYQGYSTEEAAWEAWETRHAVVLKGVNQPAPNTISKKDVIIILQFLLIAILLYKLA